MCRRHLLTVIDEAMVATGCTVYQIPPKLYLGFPSDEISVSQNANVQGSVSRASRGDSTEI